MPIGAGAAAAIAAGATIAGTAGSAYSQGKLNKKTRQWNEKMHALVRQESLADWAMVNEYNSPAAQMQRYRDAGLNPNLIYGQTNEAPVVRSSDVQGWSPRAPSFDMDARPALAAYYDVQLKEAAIKNLEVERTVKTQEALLKTAQTALIGSNKAKSDFELEMSNTLKETTLEAAQANLRKIIADTSVTLQANERAAASTASSLSEAAERILSIRLGRLKTEQETLNVRMERNRLEKLIEGVEKDNTIKQLDIDLKKQGVQPSDELWQRILARILSANGVKDIDKAAKSVFELRGLDEWQKESQRNRK